MPYRYDFFYYVEEHLVAITQFWVDRPAELKALDQDRESSPDWYHDNQMLGGVCYVDLVTGEEMPFSDLIFSPYQFICLAV
jgi:amylosucrase